MFAANNRIKLLIDSRPFVRLLCPKCNAEYEVADGVIPSAGRDVQCSTCDEVWFVEVTPAPLKSRAIDPEVISILRQEAQRELAARSEEAPIAPAPLETVSPEGPSTKLESNTKRSSQPDNNRPTVEDVDQKLVKTLSPATISQTPKQKNDVPPLNSRQRGILTAITLLGALAALYIFAPEVTEAFPAYTDWVNSYIFWVNDLRQWLQNSLQTILEYRQSFS